MRAKDGGLFQSQFWNKFQRAAGRQVFEIGDVYGQMSQARFFLGAHAYAPRFPGVTCDQGEIQMLVAKAKQEGWLFVRVEPQSEDLLQGIMKATTTKVVAAPQDTQPREILMLDIRPREEELLANMKSKTRYNIRLAKKKGVVVEEARDPQDIEAFLGIMQVTAERKSIHFHPRQYYQKFLEHFSTEDCKLLVAKKDGQVLAGSIILFFEKTAYYLHGGSGDKGRNLMAPYLLQWKGIQEAKKRACVQYDFGGVAVKTEAASGKDWSGITRFKRGFAPNTDTLVFPGAYDIVMKPWRYKVYRLLVVLRRYV